MADKVERGLSRSDNERAGGIRRTIGRGVLDVVRTGPVRGHSRSRLRHGVFLFLRRRIVPGCRLCLEHVRGRCPRYKAGADTCRIAEDYIGRMLAWIRESCPWIETKDLPTVQEWLGLEVLLWLVDRALEVEPLNPQLLKVRSGALANKIALSRDLGLTPSRKRKDELLESDTEGPCLAEILNRESKRIEGVGERV